MNRFKKLAHATYECKYHIVWYPKYRFRILRGEVGLDEEQSTRYVKEQLEQDRKMEERTLWDK